MSAVAGEPATSNAFPISIVWRSGRPVVEWGSFGDVAFTDPFFWDTYSRAVSGRATPSWETDGDVLRDLAANGDAMKPSGLIFHIGRCGSTLLTQLLSRLDRILVMSEPDAMVGLLDFPPGLTRGDRREWLRALVAVLGRRRRTTEDRFVLKLTSFHVLHLDLFLEAFPGVPWVFVMRDPESVMRSVVRKPTGLMLQRADPAAVAPLLGVRPVEAALMEPEEFLARALIRMFDTAVAHEPLLRAGRARVVDYTALPEAVWQDVAPLFDIPISDTDRLAMQSASHLYSKDPTSQRTFTADDDATAGDVLRLVQPQTREAMADRYRRLKAYAVDPPSEAR